jgi:hypothetical protein
LADYPIPKPGLIIRYAYLWKREADAGLVEGVKDRPCAVVLAVTRQKESTRVVVAPITHSQPEDEAQAVKLTTATRRRLGLDEEENWVITSEVNVFRWPGPDLRPTPAGRYEYGELPAVVFTAIKNKILGAKRTSPVERSE